MRALRYAASASTSAFASGFNAGGGRELPASREPSQSRRVRDGLV